MSPQRRNLLLGLLGLVLGGYFVKQAVETYYLQPLAAETRTQQGLEKRLREAKRDLQKASNKVPARDELVELSLPGNVEVASSTYQAWLLNLVTQLGLTNPTVDSSSPIAEGEVTRLQFNVRGKASLRQFTLLMFEFFRAGHLHKITQITLTPLGGGDRLDLQIGIEALALERASERRELTKQTAQRLVFDRVEDYMIIAKRNLFGEGSVSNIVRNTRLTAITLDRFGQQEVWFYVEPEKKTYYLHEGDTWEVDTLQLTLKEIQTDFVVVDLDGVQGRIELGKTLFDLQPQTPARPGP